MSVVSRRELERRLRVHLAAAAEHGRQAEIHSRRCAEETAAAQELLAELNQPLPIMPGVVLETKVN